MTAVVEPTVHPRLSVSALSSVRWSFEEDTVSTVVARRFDLADPSSWATSRRDLDRIVDAVADHCGWSVYLTPGRTTGAVWNEDLETFARALEPASSMPGTAACGLAHRPADRGRSLQLLDGACRTC